MIEREAQYHFTVAPEEDIDNLSLIVCCERCGSELFCGGLATLADLIDAASEHNERCIA